MKEVSRCKKHVKCNRRERILYLRESERERKKERKQIACNTCSDIRNSIFSTFHNIL